MYLCSVYHSCKVGCYLHDICLFCKCTISSTVPFAIAWLDTQLYTSTNTFTHPLASYPAFTDGGYGYEANPPSYPIASQLRTLSAPAFTRNSVMTLINCCYCLFTIGGSLFSNSLSVAVRSSSYQLDLLHCWSLLLPSPHPRLLLPRPLRTSQPRLFQRSLQPCLPPRPPLGCLPHRLDPV